MNKNHRFSFDVIISIAISNVLRILKKNNLRNTISEKTAIELNPCKNNSEKFIFELPSNLLPRSTGIDFEFNFDLTIVECKLFQISGQARSCAINSLGIIQKFPPIIFLPVNILKIIL